MVSHTGYTTALEMLRPPRGTDIGMLPYRLMQLQSLLAEGIQCSICTITQISLLLAWLLPDVVEGPVPLVYLIKVMLLAKVSCIVYDLAEAIGVLSLGATYEEEVKPVDAG
jgi:hypothetical protein